MSRKFRWTVEGTFPAGNFGPSIVKIQARPTFQIQEEFNFLSNKQFDMTTGKWENISMTFLDCNPTDSEALFKVLSSVYNFLGSSTPEEPNMSQAGELKLCMMMPDIVPKEELGVDEGMFGLAGGRVISEWKPFEEWILKEAWPTEINFGYLDYSSSENSDVEITWKYKHVIYQNLSGITMPA